MTRPSAYNDLDIERSRKGSLLYVDPAWPVVWSFNSDQDDWDDVRQQSPFPTMRAAKRAADGGASQGLYCYVLDRKGAVVYEAVPAPPSKPVRKIIKKSKINNR